MPHAGALINQPANLTVMGLGDVAMNIYITMNILTWAMNNKLSHRVDSRQREDAITL